MSAQHPRDDKWREWYTFHPTVLSVWSEVNGHQPPHESGCEFDTSRPTRPEESLFPDEPLPQAIPGTPCWCNAFCAYCDHHADRHTYSGERGPEVPCSYCPDDVCSNQ